MVAILMLIVVLLTTSRSEGSSDCLAEYNSLLEQKTLSLYEQYCCTSSNNGKIFHIMDNSGLTRFIPCPSMLPSTCPGKLTMCSYVYCFNY